MCIRDRHDALCQRASHNLVLYVCFLEECILDDSGKRNSLFHQSGRNPHRVRRGAAVLEYAGIGHNTGVQRLGARLGDLFFLQKPKQHLAGRACIRLYVIDFAIFCIRHMVIDADRLSRFCKKRCGNADAVLAGYIQKAVSYTHLDFTKLAQRLRESGMFVLGMGEQKTPSSFRVACDAFKMLEIISQNEDDISPAITAVSENPARYGTSQDEPDVYKRQALQSVLNGSVSYKTIRGEFYYAWSVSFICRNCTDQ